MVRKMTHIQVLAGLSQLLLEARDGLGGSLQLRVLRLGVGLRLKR